MNNGIFPGFTQRPGKIRSYPRFNASKWPAKAAWLGTLSGTSLLTATIASGNWSGIAFATSGQAGVVVSPSGATQLTTNGGNSWSAGGALPAGTAWNSVIYSEVSGLFVAFNADGVNPGCATSPTGAAWTQRATLTAGAWVKPAKSDAGVLLTISTGSATAGFSSADGGVTWTSRTLNSMGSGGVSVAWGNGLFAAMGQNGASSINVQTSPDAITWTNRITGFSAGLAQAFAYGPAGFTAILSVPSSFGAKQLNSLDGLTWRGRTSSIPVDSAASSNTQCNRLIYSNGLYQYLGSSGLLLSNDAVVWRGPYSAPSVLLDTGSITDITATADRTFILNGIGTAITQIPYTDPNAQDMLYVP